MAGCCPDLSDGFQVAGNETTLGGRAFVPRRNLNLARMHRRALEVSQYGTVWFLYFTTALQGV